MKSIAKQEELLKYKALVLATLDYFIKKDSGSIVYDGHDPIKFVWEQEKAKAEKYFNERHLDKLKNQLKKYTRGLRMNADLQFAAYIKERTGEDLDLFSELVPLISKVLENGKIETKAEENAIIAQLHIYEQTGMETQQKADLIHLLSEYNPPPNKRTYSKIIKREVIGDDEIITGCIVTGRRPKIDEDHFMASPDGKLKLHLSLYSQDGMNGYTYVNVHFPQMTGNVYSARGLQPAIKAYWKDNNTIVVETLKEIEALNRHFTVQSFDFTVNIEYLIH